MSEHAEEATTRPRLRRRKKKKRKANPTGDMPLVEHLQELRRRLIISVIAMVIGTIIGFIWYQSAPPGMLTLGEIMRGPYCNLPTEMRADFSHDGECRLLATNPFEMFLLRLKVGALAGLVLSSPIWLYQIWAFIVPGLHKHERRWTFLFVSIAVALFVVGALLAYFIVSYGLEFLVSVGDETQAAAFTGNQYYNFVLALILIFGISFEVPLILVTLNIMDLLNYDDVKDKRRIIIVVLFILAAVLTPGGEPFSMVILAIALNVLVELAFQFMRINDKRRGYDKRGEWDDLDDEEASELEYQPEPVAPAEPGPAPAPVATEPEVREPTKRRQAPAENTPSANYFDDVL